MRMVPEGVLPWGGSCCVERRSVGEWSCFWGEIKQRKKRCRKEWLSGFKMERKTKTRRGLRVSGTEMVLGLKE